MKAKAYFLQCITNLHVGSGDANYGIVDKLVQRDTVYNYPTIHASSLKGALREHFSNVMKDDEVDEIFGKKTNNDEDASSGNCNFLNADLVTLPVRCSHKQFALTLCQQSIKFVNSKTKMLMDKELLKKPSSSNTLFTIDTIDVIYLEDYSISKENHASILKDNITVEGDFDAFDKQYAFVDDDKFDNYTKDLPVIARNKLGENKNLWYEEVVPHQTIFITYLIPNTTMDRKIFDEFEKHLLTNTIQIGANSSVGYGLCKFYKISFTENNNNQQ